MTTSSNNSSPVSDAEALLRTDDVAKLLSLSAYSVRRLARQQRIPALRLSKTQLRFRRADVEKFIEEAAQ